MAALPVPTAATTAVMPGAPRPGLSPAEKLMRYAEAVRTRRLDAFLPPARTLAGIGAPRPLTATLPLAVPAPPAPVGPPPMVPPPPPVAAPTPAPALAPEPSPTPPPDPPPPLGPTPALTSIEPAHGPDAGGTHVTLRGANLEEGALVAFGTAMPSAQFRDATCIEVDLPAHPAGTVDVVLMSTDGQYAVLEGGYHFDGPPRIDRVTPDRCAPEVGTPILIDGAEFTPGSTVTLDGHPVPADVECPERILATALPRETQGPVVVRVTTADGVVVERGDLLRYEQTPPPRIDAIQPARLASGKTQTAYVSGDGFVDGCAVRVGGEVVPATFLSPQRLELWVPAIQLLGHVDLQVTNPNGQRHEVKNAVQLCGPPELAGVQPAEGSPSGGEVVVVRGAGFDRECQVFFGAVAAKLTWETDGALRVITPAGAPGPVDVIVANPDGQSASLPGGFKYAAGATPVVTAVEPATGPVLGGTGVLVRGEHFDAVKELLLGGRPAAFKARGNELAFVAPPRLRDGAVDLELRTADGTRVVRKGAFQYTAVPPPAIKSISPNRAAVKGGTELTITGENFFAGATVLVSGEPAPKVTVKDKTTIVFKAPPGAAGTMADITVQSPTGQEAVAKRAFLYDPRF
jgi:large repetitive protein